MTSVNKVILIGRAGKDSEFKDASVSVCNVPIATSESWKDKHTGEKRSEERRVGKECRL